MRLFTNDLYDWNNAASADQGYTINGLNQVTAAGSTSFTYDARGGLASDGVHAYGYDTAHDQLTSFTGGGSNVALGYDSLHRLTQVQDASTTRFIYDGSVLSEELDTSGNVLARYVPGPDGSPILWYNGSGTSDRRWLLKDQQGSVISVANSSGQALATNTYDPYGLPGSSNLGRLQYTGQPWIPDIGLYDYRARTYSPTLGRFLQTDPIGYGDGMNWYAYVRNDPVNMTDPKGTDPLIGATVGALFGAGEGLVAFATTPNANAATFAVDVFGGAAAGGLVGALDPSFGVLTLAAGLSGVLDAGGQIATNGGFNNFNIGETVGATVGGFIGAGLGASITSVGLKQISSVASKGLKGVGEGALDAAGGFLGARPAIGGGLLGGLAHSSPYPSNNTSPDDANTITITISRSGGPATVDNPNPDISFDERGLSDDLIGLF